MSSNAPAPLASGAGAPGSPGQRRALVLALLTSLVVAAGLRFAYLGYQAPQDPDPDCNVVWQGLYLDDRLNGEQRAPFPVLDESYPILLGAVLAVLPGRLMPLRPDAELESQLAAAGRPMVLGRVLAALAGVALVPLTFLLARRLLPPVDAALAAALVATSFLLVLHSRQARPHVPAAALCLATVLVAARTARAPSLRGHLAAGLLGGLAIACLQSGLAVLPALLAGQLLAARRAGRKTWAWAAAGCAVLVPVVVLGYAHVLFGVGRADRPFVEEGMVVLGAHQIPFEAFNGRGFAKCWTFLRNYDPAFGVVCGFGGLVLIARAAHRLARRAPPCAASTSDWIVALSFAVPSVLMLGLYERTQGRFLTPLMPFLALAGAAGVSALAAGLARLTGPVVALLVLVPAALATPLWTDLLLLEHQRRPDSYELAGDWVRAHVDREQEVIAADRFCTLPVLASGYLRELSFAATDINDGGSFWKHLRTGVFSTWDLYQARLDPAVLAERGYRVENLFTNPGDLTPEQYYARVEQRLEESGADYALVAIPGSYREPSDPSRGIVIASGAQLIQRFPADAPATTGDNLFQFETRPALALLRRAVGLGRNLELYRLSAR